MYYQFTRAVKKRMMEVLRYSFNAHEQHKDVVGFIREKYEFRERPQKGIVIQGSSISPLSLSADNFMGTLHSHLMYARVGDHEGSFIEWVREDDRLLEESLGFPSAPGVYYLQIESTGVNPTNGCEEFQFYVDPLLTVEGEPLITFATGDEPSALLLNAPMLGRSLRLFNAAGYELLAGTALTLTADESLYIGGSPTHRNLGFPTGQVPTSALAPNSGDYTFQVGVDDEFVLRINGKTATVVFTAGTLTVEQVVDELRAAMDLANIGRSEAPLTVEGGALRIGASASLEFVDDITSPANAVFGFTEGFVPVMITGVMVQPTMPLNATFRVVVDGVEVETELTPYPQRAVIDIAAEITAGTAATSLLVGTVDAGDFAINETTGEVTFLHSFDPGEEVFADYRYPDASRGPFPLADGNCANAEAIPGAILAFGQSLKDGDIGAVVVTAEREVVADVYGGKADVSLDIDIIARDAMTRSEMADLVTLFFFQWWRERLAEEGLAIEQVSMGGESEEPYDEVGDDYYYLANLSLSMKADWELYIERPLIIRRVSPSSYGQEARWADDQDLDQRPDGVVALAELPNTVLRAAGDFERIR